MSGAVYSVPITGAFVEALIPLSGGHGDGKFAKVDAEDYPELSRHKWYLNNSYVYRIEKRDGKAKTVYMHREVMRAAPSEDIDHRFHDGLDNRKNELRRCTHKQNTQNARSLAGSSQYKGVVWDTNRGKWLASIRYEGRHFNLGRFDDEKKAARAYDQAARFAYGEYAYANFPDTLPLDPILVRENSRTRLRGPASRKELN